MIDYFTLISSTDIRLAGFSSFVLAYGSLSFRVIMSSMVKTSIFSLLLLLLFLSGTIFIFQAKAETLNNAGKNSVRAIFVFGDSTADPGNNNYISTAFKSDFPPYGRDFSNQIPTGRFTNGRLANDYIAKYLGIKDLVPPYLDPNLKIEELVSGVSFASAGSGFDPLTPRLGNVISLSKQLEYFKEYQLKVAAAIGQEKTGELIRNAMFLVSAGTNDFVVNYFTMPIRRKAYTISGYTDFCLQNVQHFLQDLWDVGARRIGVVGLPPMGCLPVVITIYADHPLTSRGCVDSISSVAQDYNRKLQNQLNATQIRLAANGSRIAYLDVYGPLAEITSQGRKYDFDEVSRGCCGTGWLETSFMCNPRSFVCPDASKYVFWDSIHPTEKSYGLVFQARRPTIDYIVSD
ncbi:GDSL esterase/lipase At5g45960 [Coffea arabica]|uniref:GDSL esterase/lipase At5g45960 n=1 Tax=Coffea arabica TaxID=13443 RepID=A0A6P6WCV3_COFAR|nr:GDSL esterase/lipase At5g45960-like [Coffea arabica]